MKVGAVVGNCFVVQELHVVPPGGRSVLDVELRSADPHRVLRGEAGGGRGDGLAGGDGGLDGGGDGGLQLGDDQLDQLGLVHGRLGSRTADHGGGGRLDTGRDHGGVVHSGQGTGPGPGDVPHHHEALLHVPLLVVSIRPGGVGDGHQGSGGVDVAVGSLDVVAVPGLVLVQVGLGLLVGHLVAVLVGGRGCGLLSVDGRSHRDAGRFDGRTRESGGGGGGERIRHSLGYEGLELGGDGADHLVGADLWSGLGETNHHQQHQSHCVLHAYHGPTLGYE